MRFRKIILKTLVFFFVFCLGYILCVVEVMYIRDRMNGIHFYVYDMEYKIENFHKRGMEKASTSTGVSPESSAAKELIAGGRTNIRPLVEVGPFFVSLLDDGDSSWFSVHKISSMVPLVLLENPQQSKRLNLYSSVEKSMELPRFMFSFHYSEDDIYERGSISVYEEVGEDRKHVRTYFDSKGTGVFDIMRVYENGIENTYRLNGFVWTKDDDWNLE